MSPDSKVAQRQWYITQRWQSFEGESRANLLRIVCIGVFYAIELVQYHLLEAPSEAMQSFHWTATLLCVVWSIVALATLVCLRARVFPAILKFIVTGLDIILLTTLILLTERAAQSPLVFVYCLVLAVAALRFSLPLVWCSTIGCMAAYIVVLAITDARNESAWFDDNHPAPVIDELVVLATLALTGIVLGQVIRRTRSIASAYAERISNLPTGTSND